MQVPDRMREESCRSSYAIWSRGCVPGLSCRKKLRQRRFQRRGDADDKPARPHPITWKEQGMSCRRHVRKACTFSGPQGLQDHLISLPIIPASFRVPRLVDSRKNGALSPRVKPCEPCATARSPLQLVKKILFPTVSTLGPYSTMA